MLGYIVWTTDRLTTLARAKTTAADPGRNRAQQPSMPILAAAPALDAAHSPGAPAATMTRPGEQALHGEQAGRPPLAPKLAACGKIAMSITMGYMLILML